MEIILTSEDIEKLLQELGEVLKKKFRQPVKIMLIGGAYMILMFQNRETTQDIDICPMSMPPSNNPNDETKKFVSAVNSIARQHRLPQKWMNDISFDIVGGISPNTIELWFTCGMLEVYRPSTDFMLALKLFADRDKDKSDIETLCNALQVTTRSQAQEVLDRYIERRFQKEYRVYLALDKWFP